MWWLGDVCVVGVGWGMCVVGGWGRRCVHMVGVWWVQGGIEGVYGWCVCEWWMGGVCGGWVGATCVWWMGGV